MKIRLFGNGGIKASFVAILTAANCLAQSPPPAIPATTSTAEQEKPGASPGTAAAVPESTNTLDIAEAPARPLAEEKTLPPSIRPGRPVGEIIKLANSGVEQSVMLAYVTNSTSTFNLSAEEIIYLKDIGVPDPVVTAMMVRDQALRAESQSALAAAPPQPAPGEEAAPPNSGDVAPQPDAAGPAYPPDAAPPPAELAGDGNFYDALAPYGNWVDVQGYGPCWQPTVVVGNPAWQPYYDCGRWVYSDCGWYWVSDYSWGWAPFHYGRWFHHQRLGWCWMPDRVWGPSWVSWRYTDAYCGWAPLPPGSFFTVGIGLTFGGRHVGPGDDCGLHAHDYRFVAWHHFHDHDYNHYRLPPTHRDELFRNSLVATRFTGRGEKIANDGLPPQKVTAATGVQVRAVTLRDSPGALRSGTRTEQYDPTSRTMAVYRPTFERTPRAGSAARSASAPSSVSSASALSAPGAPRQNPPLVLRGPQSAAERENPPASSLVIIGRKDPNGKQSTYRSTAPSTSARPAPSANSAESARSSARSGSPTPWADNEVPRQSENPVVAQSPLGSSAYRPPVFVPRNNGAYGYERPATTYRTAPTYQPPARSAPEAPRYSPPANQRSYTPPAYNNQRSYSPPAPSAPARAPVAESRPAPSAPAQSGRSQR